jgi:hypothetical protein
MKNPSRAPFRLTTPKVRRLRVGGEGGLDKRHIEVDLIDRYKGISPVEASAGSERPIEVFK